MRMWKEKTWQYEMTGIDGNTILFGVNIFDYRWNFIKEEIVKNKTIFTLLKLTIQNIFLVLWKQVIVYGTSIF